jgi:hypothetical protein
MREMAVVDVGARLKNLKFCKSGRQLYPRPQNHQTTTHKSITA